VENHRAGKGCTDNTQEEEIVGNVEEGFDHPHDAYAVFVASAVAK
jgi:hypothetical protein